MIHGWIHDLPMKDMVIFHIMQQIAGLSMCFSHLLGLLFRIENDVVNLKMSFGLGFALARLKTWS